MLEEVLPAGSAAGPTDYQLVERLDGERGRSEVVAARGHPAVGPLDPDALVEAFLDAIGGGDGGER